MNGKRQTVKEDFYEQHARGTPLTPFNHSRCIDQIWRVSVRLIG